MNFNVNVSLTGLIGRLLQQYRTLALVSGDQLPAEALFGGSSEPTIGTASTTPTMPPIVIVAFAMKVRRLTLQRFGGRHGANGAPAAPWEAPAFESDNFVLHRRAVRWIAASFGGIVNPPFTAAPGRNSDQPRRRLAKPPDQTL